MNTLFKAAGLILPMIITGCGSEKNESAVNLDVAVDLGADINTQLSITATQEVLEGTASIKQFTLTYNVDGQKISEEFDANNDGINDRAFSYYYDATGSREIATTDSDGNGVVNTKTIYSSDGSTHTESLYFDDDEDGTFDRIIVSTLSENGSLLLSESTDSNADGNFNKITTYEYDTNNNLISAHHDYDYYGDGTIDEQADEHIAFATPPKNDDDRSLPADGADYNTTVRTDTFNINNDPVTATVDTNGDGTANKTITYQYNANGLLISESHVDIDDASSELLIELNRDEYENIISKTTTDQTTGVTVITFGDSGEITEITYDSNNDGGIERKVNYAYSGDTTILDSIEVPTSFNWN